MYNVCGPIRTLLRNKLTLFDMIDPVSMILAYAMIGVVWARQIIFRQAFLA